MIVIIFFAVAIANSFSSIKASCISDYIGNFGDSIESISIDSPYQVNSYVRSTITLDGEVVLPLLNSWCINYDLTVFTYYPYNNGTFAIDYYTIATSNDISVSGLIPRPSRVFQVAWLSNNVNVGDLATGPQEWQGESYSGCSYITSSDIQATIWALVQAEGECSSPSSLCDDTLGTLNVCNIAYLYNSALLAVPDGNEYFVPKTLTNPIVPFVVFPNGLDSYVQPLLVTSVLSLWEYTCDSPTVSPTPLPTVIPTIIPTTTPTLTPTISFAPTKSPTSTPTHSPIISFFPTAFPSISPTVPPTISFNPTTIPTFSPTVPPSRPPTLSPTVSPTGSPLCIPGGQADLLKAACLASPACTGDGSQSVTYDWYANFYNFCRTQSYCILPTPQPSSAPTPAPTTASPTIYRYWEHHYVPTGIFFKRSVSISLSESVIYGGNNLGDNNWISTDHGQTFNLIYVSPRCCLSTATNINGSVLFCVSIITYTDPINISNLYKARSTQLTAPSSYSLILASTSSYELTSVACAFDCKVVVVCGAGTSNSGIIYYSTNYGNAGSFSSVAISQPIYYVYSQGNSLWAYGDNYLLKPTSNSNPSSWNVRANLGSKSLATDASGTHLYLLAGAYIYRSHDGGLHFYSTSGFSTRTLVQVSCDGSGQYVFVIDNYQNTLTFYSNDYGSSFNVLTKSQTPGQLTFVYVSYNFSYAFELDSHYIWSYGTHLNGY